MFKYFLNSSVMPLLIKNLNVFCPVFYQKINKFFLYALRLQLLAATLRNYQTKHLVI